jgi:hypothetical protein
MVVVVSNMVPNSMIDSKVSAAVDPIFNNLPDAIWLPGRANWIFTFIGFVMTWVGAAESKGTVLGFGIFLCVLGGLISLVVGMGYCCSCLDTMVAAQLEAAVRGQNKGIQNIGGVNFEVATDDHIISRARKLVEEHIFMIVAFSCGPQIFVIALFIIAATQGGGGNAGER